MSSDSPRTAAVRERDFRLLHPQEAETVYRWLPLEDDCIRHHGPHKGFRCNGAIGRLIEVREAASPAASGDALREESDYDTTILQGYAASPPLEGLDVERLIAALHEGGWKCFGEFPRRENVEPILARLSDSREGA